LLEQLIHANAAFTEAAGNVPAPLMNAGVTFQGFPVL